MASVELRCKKLIENVRVHLINGKHVILLSDVLKAFKHPMTRFTRDGKSLGFVLDEKGRPLEPLQIQVNVHRNEIIDCEKYDMNKFDTHHAREESNEQILAELRKLQSEFARLGGKVDRIEENTQLSIEKADAILRQTFELAEYTVPRLFIILPEQRTAFNPANWLAHTYRLYFICECESERHVAFHKGYKIKQPRSFFRKYGPYLKNMLIAARIALSISSFIMPPLGLVAGLVDQFPTFLLENNFPEDVSTNLNQMVEVVDKALKEVLSSEMLINPHSIDLIGGAELREIASFLEMHDDYDTLGNLSRSTNEHGQVRWLCFYHYRQFSSEKRLKNLRREFCQLGGELRLGTAIIDQSSVKKFNEMLDVLRRGLSIFKLRLTNCEIPIETFKKFLFIVTHQNLIHYIEFHDVVISPPMGFVKSHSKIIVNLEEAINNTPHLTIQYIVSSEKDIFEKRISLLDHFASHSTSRLLLELRTNDMLEQFACSGLSNEDVEHVRQWIQKNQSSWKIHRADGNRVMFIHQLDTMKESLFDLTHFLLTFVNLRKLDYYHAEVNDEIFKALANNTTSLEALHFYESNRSQSLPTVEYLVSKMSGKRTLPSRITSIWPSHIIQMFKENKSLTEITFPSITGLHFNDMIMIAQAIATHPSLSTIHIGTLPSSSPNHLPCVFTQLLHNPSIEDFTCTINEDEEFEDLTNALEMNTTLKRLSIEICIRDQTEINERFCQYVSRIPTLKKLILSFFSTIDCSQLLDFLSKESPIKTLSLTRVFNWQSLIYFINNGWKLTNLTLSHCPMQFSDIESLVTSLKSTPQNLLKLNLSHNHLSDDCVTELGTLLHHDSFPLTHLNLSKNSFSVSCILNLIRILHRNTSFKMLDIRSCFPWNHQKRSNSTDLQQLKEAIAHLSIENEFIDIQWTDCN